MSGDKEIVVEVIDVKVQRHNSTTDVTDVARFQRLFPHPSWYEIPGMNIRVTKCLLQYS